MDFDILKEEPRLLVEVPLKPIQGTRFQPTGFPDLGAATYNMADGKEMLLLESAQSMANRMENVCWNESLNDLVDPLKGIPYVKSTLPDGTVTNTILEAHRLNSPYIVKSAEFENIKDEIGFEKNKPFDRRKLANALMKYDLNSLIHGIFLEKVGGTVRIPRSLSGFVEAEEVTVAPSGGAKFDRVQPGTGENTPYGKANEGYGNVPFHRDEYTGKITAYFNLDISQIKGYGLGEDAENLLVAIALYKIRKVLDEGLRFRTACDLEVADDIIVKRPDGFKLPATSEIESELPGLIEKAKDSFADPAVTEVTYKK